MAEIKQTDAAKSEACFQQIRKFTQARQRKFCETMGTLYSARAKLILKLAGHPLSPRFNPYPAHPK